MMSQFLAFSSHACHLPLDVLTTMVDRDAVSVLDSEAATSGEKGFSALAEQNMPTTCEPICGSNWSAFLETQITADFARSISGFGLPQWPY